MFQNRCARTRCAGPERRGTPPLRALTRRRAPLAQRRVRSRCEHVFAGGAPLPGRVRDLVGEGARKRAGSGRLAAEADACGAGFGAERPRRDGTLTLAPFQLGSTAVGIRTQEGVVLAAEKRVASPLIEAHTYVGGAGGVAGTTIGGRGLIPMRRGAAHAPPPRRAASVEKILEIDSHIGVTMSGIQSDARMLVERARVDAQNHRFTYDEPLKVKSVAQGICDIALNFGEGERREVVRAGAAGAAAAGGPRPHRFAPPSPGPSASPSSSAAWMRRGRSCAWPPAAPDAAGARPALTAPCGRATGSTPTRRARAPPTRRWPSGRATRAR